MYKLYGLGHAIKTCKAPLRELWKPTGNIFPSAAAANETSTVMKETVKEKVDAQSSTIASPLEKGSKIPH